MGASAMPPRLPVGLQLPVSGMFRRKLEWWQWSGEEGVRVEIYAASLLTYDTGIEEREAFNRPAFVKLCKRLSTCCIDRLYLALKLSF